VQCGIGTVCKTTRFLLLYLNNLLPRLDKFNNLLNTHEDPKALSPNRTRVSALLMSDVELEVRMSHKLKEQ